LGEVGAGKGRFPVPDRQVRKKRGRIKDYCKKLSPISSILV
jgi:hypothetical protein